MVKPSKYSGKRGAFARGRDAEQVVEDYLVAAGYEILGRNLRVGHGEIDLLALRDAVVAVVEVKSRGPRAWIRAFDSVDREKRMRLREAARILWAERFDRDPRVASMRFDVAAVHFDDDGEVRLEYLRGAF